MSTSRKDLMRFIEEARSERDAMQRDLWRAIEERNNDTIENIWLRRKARAAKATTEEQS